MGHSYAQRICRPGNRANLRKLGLRQKLLIDHGACSCNPPNQGDIALPNPSPQPGNKRVKALHLSPCIHRRRKFKGVHRVVSLRIKSQHIHSGYWYAEFLNSRSLPMSKEHGVFKHEVVTRYFCVDYDSCQLFFSKRLPDSIRSRTRRRNTISGGTAVSLTFLDVGLHGESASDRIEAKVSQREFDNPPDFFFVRWHNFQAAPVRGSEHYFRVKKITG